MMTDLHGLTSEQAAKKLAEVGPNLLPQGKPATNLRILLSAFEEPMIFLLAACAVVYMFIGEPIDGLFLVGSIAVVVAINFYQSHKSERALEALRSFSSPRALVVRDGKTVRIPGREVVPGDLVMLSEGDRVPADGKLQTANFLAVDESLLTGESVSVTKEKGNSVFSGTLVVGGRGEITIEFTGSKTELGKIGKSLSAAEDVQTSLQLSLEKLVKRFGFIGVAISSIIVLLYGLIHKQWAQAFLVGLSTAMSLLPEEFPLVLSIFLATGAWRLSKKNVLIRKASSTEALGSVTVLCVDKTGTLTLNQMSVKELNANNRTFKIESKTELPEDFHSLIEFAALASHINPFDPMEQAISRTLTDLLSNTEHIHENWILEKEYPLSKELLAMSCAWKSKESNLLTIAAKGAPEAIFDLCHFSNQERQSLLKQVEEMSSRGLRVLGVAKSSARVLPPNQHDFDFEFLGLLGMEDPPRPGVKQAIEDCAKAGIRVVMITGDYIGTAQSIARQIGLRNPENYLTGAGINNLSEAQLNEAVKSTNIFARMIPEQKLKLVQSLQSNGEIVAMTGDGVNDAPSLKASNIGVSMGSRGTDVAREASDIVLLDDNFLSLVHGIRQGRKIYNNIERAIMYILTVHIPIAGLAILPILFGMPVVLLAPEIVFLELIIDPTCTLVFDTDLEDRDIMKRPPRPLGQKLIDKSGFFLTALRGLGILAFVFLPYVWNLKQGMTAPEAKTIAFAGLIISNLILIYFSIGRDWLNRLLIVVTLLALSLLALVVFWPPLSSIFQFAPLPLSAMKQLSTSGLGLIFFLYLTTKRRVKLGL